MTAPRPADLSAEGFTRCALLPAALAHWAWSVELVFEQDRRLRLVDETVLRLVGAGISDPDRIATLMGVDESDIVPSSVANLMRAGALQHDAGLKITPGGQAALDRAALRAPAREDAQVHFDPYRATVAFSEGGDVYLSTNQMRSRGLHQLPIPPAPGQRELFAKHIEIQSAFESRLRAKGGAGAVDLLRLVPVGKPLVVFEEVELEVWHRPSDRTWRWRLLRDDAEETAASILLRSLEDEGADVLPFVPRCDLSKSSEFDRKLSEIFEAAAPIVDADRADAVAAASTVSAFIPAYPAGYADLGLLLDLADKGGRSASRARVIVGAADATRNLRGADPLGAAIELLEKSGIAVRIADAVCYHGALQCDERVFVMRYRVEPVEDRRERGVPCVECRATSAEQAKALMAEFAALFPKANRGSR